MNSRLADALIAKGVARQKAGQLAESIQCFLEATQAHPTALAYWHLIAAQMASNQFDQARTNCQHALGLYPHEPAFYLALARVEETVGRRDEAHDILRRAADLFPDNRDVAAEHANTQIRAGHFAQAVPSLERIAALKPSAKAYRNLFKIKLRAGDRDGAQRAALEGRERFPLDTALASTCGAFAPEAEAESQAAMRAALPTMDATTRSLTLSYMTKAQAIRIRKAANLPLEAATDWKDLVHWADPEGLATLIASLDAELAAGAPRAEAMIERASAAIGQMDWVGAEQWFAQVRGRQTRTVADVATFDLEFYGRLEKLTDEAIWSPFPPVSEIVGRSAWPATMIFVACDPNYFELFFQKFLASLLEKKTNVGVHVHLLDGTAEEWHRAAKTFQTAAQVSLSMTAETGARQKFGAAARTYYHASRYIRFHQCLAQSTRPMWIMDVDTIVESDPEPVFEALSGNEIALTTTSISLEPWAKIRAGLVGIDPTTAGLRYLRLVAAYISHWFNNNAGLQWGIDQQALFGTYFYLEQQGCAPRTGFLSEAAMNIRDELPLIFRPSKHPRT